MNPKIVDIIENNIEYQLLPYQFFLLTSWGIWTPNSWSLKIKNIHYIFFATVFLSDFLLCAEMLIQLVSSLGTKDFKLLNLFFVSANITAVYKSVKLKRNHEIIRSFILEYFDDQWMTLQNSTENEIHAKINSRIRHVTIMFSASMIGIVLLKAMSPLAESSSLALPVDAWYPYCIEEPKWFWLTYLQQVILGCSAVCVHIGVDTLFVGFLLKTSCQINVLKNRLKNATNYSKLDDKNNVLIECIRHHERIYRFGKELNAKFQEILIILVVFSLPNICINIYALSSYAGDINVQYVATFFSTTSALLQFFICCWYGNDVTLNSVQIKNAVYEMDWTKFDASTQKLLVIIMMRSSNPILFSVGYFIPLNLESFLKIIKASYTTFNLLQQTAD